MLNFLPGPVLSLISILLLILSTSICSTLICIGGLIKFLLPIDSVRTQLRKLMDRCMWVWATCNGGILYLLSDIEWDIEGLENLSQDQWYLVISNHLSGFDIAVQTYILRNNIPMLKFFLKKELLYIPFIGMGCWALDMPFMHRTSADKLKKNPKLKGKDLATTRRSCEKFRNIPTSIMNYVEGSRFSEQKRLRQQSPYRHLLKPKASGIAFALSAMGDQFTNVLDITLLYPEAINKSALKEAMNGRIKKVVIRIRALPVPEVDDVRYVNDPQYRVEFQRWLNAIWQEKDETLHQLILQHEHAQQDCALRSVTR